STGETGPVTVLSKAFSQTTPEPARQTTPDPPRQATPDPAHQTTPEPARQTTPDPARQATPDPAHQTTPDPARQATPDPAHQTTPDPARQTTPEPARQATPEPAHQASLPLTVCAQGNQSGMHSAGEVQMCQLILPCHSNQLGELSTGQLLKWMDSTACLAAERHAGMACVTASMDDIQFEEIVKVGQVISIRARVNRAFKTSMEVGIDVSVQDVVSSLLKRVCVAYSTFVGKPTGEQRVSLKPVDLRGGVEELEHSLASERRRLRLSNEEAFSNLTLNYLTVRDKGAWSRGDAASRVSTELTRVESTELVLPPHANHHGNTFGGQIMAWMENAAAVAASRLCGSHPTLRAVDMFSFRGPSAVGDRLVLKAMVNNAFQTRVEVGVRVEAYSCEEWNQAKPRHINSAFLIYQLPNTEGHTHTFPDITFTTQAGERRYFAAIVRRRIRMAKKHILYSREEGSLSVPWDKSNQAYLGYNNVAGLTVLAGRQGWEASSISSKGGVFVHEDANLLCMKVEMKVQIPASHAYSLLSDLTLRPLWDKHYLSCEEVERGNEEETVYHIKCSPISGAQSHDFVLLLSKRQPCKDGDPFVIALRSVTVETVLPVKDRVRSEANCAGFLIHRSGPTACEVCYYTQVTSGVLPYVAGNLAGLSRSMEDTASSCIAFLEQHLLTTAF
ncbi:acetyl-coenzyme A thioesterase, partial [Chanos chanos]|uniref:Acetyl-coenzyme A thioesterase n=1 Tax=Chanos chanos TaxID=29144 RepID=A0A6J2UXA2_CHACN